VKSQPSLTSPSRQASLPDVLRFAHPRTGRRAPGTRGTEGCTRPPIRHVGNVVFVDARDQLVVSGMGTGASVVERSCVVRLSESDDVSICQGTDKALLSANRASDQLVITKLDRLARSLEHLIDSPSYSRSAASLSSFSIRAHEQSRRAQANRRDFRSTLWSPIGACGRGAGTA
jgi:hypothetical protein